jgi:autotransporter-associated beta strand protein
MIKRIIPTFRVAALLAIAIVLNSQSWLRAQSANWSGSAGDGDWNNALNWDIGVPAEGTNAVVAGGATTIVNYNAPMLAGSFGSVAPGFSLSAVFNINASGFVIGAPGTSAATVTGSGNRLNVNAGGVMSITNGGLTLSAAAATLASGGSINMLGALQVGNSTATATMTNSGGNLSAGSTAINPNNSSGSPSCILVISGGSNYLGDVSIRRANPSAQPAPGTEGLVVSNGVVNMTSLALSTGNSFATMFVTGGAVTNTGTFIVGQQNGGNNRATRFLQIGGLVVSTSTDGVRIGVSNSTQTVNYIVQGGTNIVERFFIGDGTNGATGIAVNLTNAGNIYIGSGGIVSNLQGNINIALNNAGLFGASADWSSSAALVLNTGSGSFNAADLAGTAHNIALSGVIRGPGGLSKTGAGTLTLNATNTYGGATTVNQGVLALTATGSISNSTQLTVNGSGILDLSAVAAPALLSGQTLAGNGAVVGDLTALSGSVIRPGGVSAAGTLTLSNNLTEASGITGGVINSFDLSNDPTGTIHPNDLLNINGDLNLTGLSVIQVNPLNGPLPGGGVYKVIQYTGNLNGSLANLVLSGIAGGLSNNAALKTIFVIVQSTRSPTSVAWLGGLGGNAWDIVTTSNWLNGASRDIFVSGDTVRFDSTGANNPLVNVVGSLGPLSTTVDSTSNYTFSGSGSIDGPGGITKTNSGTLSLLTTNGYLGSTIVGQGTLEVIRLANGGSASSIGSANSDPTNLVSYGAVLRYFGPSAGTDHGMTLNDTGLTVDVTNNASRLAASGVLAGPGALTKIGPGTLALAGANSYAGGTINNNGVLELNTTAAVTNAGVTNLNAALRIATGTTSTLTNVLDFNGTCTVDLNNTPGDTHLTGAWSGNATVNVINQQNASRTFTVGGNGDGGGNILNFTGTIAMGTNIGFLRFNDAGNFNFGTTNLTIDLGTGTANFLVRNGGITVDVGAISGGPGTKVTGRASGSSGTVTYSIGGKNLSTTFAGTIANGNNSTAITKVGTGTWTLSGSNTYSGVTVISNGVLALSGSGSLAVTPSITVVSNAYLDTSARTDGALTLNSGQTLNGDGAVLGSVIASSGSIIDPGPTPGVISTFTITNSLQVQSGSTLNMDLDYDQFLASGTNDLITGLASVTYGGTLNLNIISIETNSVFKLFSANSYNGAFDAINPPFPPLAPINGLGFAWDTSHLTIDGTLRITILRPSISSVAISGTDFVISAINGPAAGNVVVLTSTNVAAPLNTWSTLVTTQFDGAGNLTINDPISTGTAQRFYVLQLQ